MKSILLFLLFIPNILLGQTQIILHDTVYKDLKIKSIDFISLFVPNNLDNHKFHTVELVTESVMPKEPMIYRSKPLEAEIRTDTIILNKVKSIMDDSLHILNTYFHRFQTKYGYSYYEIDAVSKENPQLWISIAYMNNDNPEVIEIRTIENKIAIELLENISNLFGRKEKRYFLKLINAFKKHVA